MKKVSKFVVIICTLLSFPLSGQHVGKITIEQQVSLPQFSATGTSSLLLESIVIEIALADMMQLDEESADALYTASINSNRSTRQLNRPAKNVVLPLFQGALLPLERSSHLEKQRLNTIPTLLLVENIPQQVSVVPANLKLPTTHQNRPKALGSTHKF